MNEPAFRHAAVIEAVAEILDDDWTAETAVAWREMLGDIDAYAKGTPRSDVRSPAFPSYYERKAAQA